MKRLFLFYSILLSVTLSVAGQNGSGSDTPEIIKSIEANDSKVNIHQDGRLDKMLNNYIGREIKLTGPYTGPG